MAQNEAVKPGFIQNNYNAQNVTGTGDINNQYSAPVQIIHVLAEAVERDPNIPADEKRTLTDHLRALMANQYFAGLVTSGAYEGLKTVVEHLTK